MGKGIFASLALSLTLLGSLTCAQPSFLKSLKPLPSQEQQAKVVEVVVRGESATSFEDARHQAIREAIERVCGVYLWSETRAEDFEVVTDRIVTQVSGFARVEEIARGRRDDSYWVLARVFVLEKPLIEHLRRAGLLRQWRVALIVPETLLRLPQPPDPAVETALMRLLVAAGFRVVDRDVSEQYRYEDVVGDARQGNTSALRLLLQKTGADILLLGEAFAQELGRLPGGLVSCRARVELRGILKETGEVLFADSEHHSAVDATAELAGKKALEKAADQLGKRLVDHLLLLPAAEKMTVTLVVETLPSVAEAAQVEDALNKVAGVLRVARDEFVEGRLYLQVEVRTADRDALADRLQQALQQVRVISATRVLIRCEWKP